MESRDRDWLKMAALVFALIATASAEYELARAAGFNAWVAAAVPGALDIYTVRAMRAHRDVRFAISAMIGVNAASHLVTAGLLPVSVWLVVAVSAIAPLVLWRVHSIGSLPQVVDTQPEVNTPVPAPMSTPVFTSKPSLVAAQVSPVNTVASTVAKVTIPAPIRLSTDEARKVIEYGWENGLTVRDTAAAATRSPAYVSKVFTAMEAQRGPRPVAGQLTLVSAAP